MAPYSAGDAGLGGAGREAVEKVEMEPLMKEEAGEDKNEDKGRIEPVASARAMALPQVKQWASSPVMFILAAFGLYTLWAVIGSSDGYRIAKEAVGKGIKAGIPGAAAMLVQVVLFMWMRTIVNYQYRHGGGARAAVKTLWADGGVCRFYRGVVPAVVQAVLTRFGDTAMNEGVQSFLDAHASTAGLPIGAKTMACSLAASLFRIAIMPIDTVKTMQQVQGRSAVSALMARVMAHGPACLYEGWMAVQAVAITSHYPWFATRNLLRIALDAGWWGIYKDVVIGICASLVSDLASNSMRVLKTLKQTSDRPVSYREAVVAVGIRGLLFRGLKVKIFFNCIQSVVFNVVWERFQVLFR